MIHDVKARSWDDVGVTRIPLHGKYGKGKYALVDGDYDGEYLSQFEWLLSATGVVYRYKFLGEPANRAISKYSNIYLHQMVVPPCFGMYIHHINGDRLDNRSRNLRLITVSESRRLARPRTHR